MKPIRITNRSEGPGIQYFGWSGRGWADGGPVSAGPMSSGAPSWERWGSRLGINIVRVGFSMKHFLPGDLKTGFSFSQSIKKGMENTDVSWAKSRDTSYSYSIERCRDLGWKILICLNPSLNTEWEPHRLTESTHLLEFWESFCFHFAGFIEDGWPGTAGLFEITNEPDIGYFDGETALPDYPGIPRGITPERYRLLLERAFRGIRRAVPDAKIVGPGLARWNRKWIEKVLHKNDPIAIDGLSYHNVRGDLQDADTLRQAKSLLSGCLPSSSGIVLNSEWAWWPDHDPDDLETALRAAQILHRQAAGGAYASLYLGPAQPRDFKKGLGVLKFDPEEPDSVETTKTFYAFRLMARGILGGQRLAVFNPLKRLEVSALHKDNQEIVVTLLNPNRKKLKDVSILIDESLDVMQNGLLKIYRFDQMHRDDFMESIAGVLDKFCVEPQSIVQFVIPMGRPAVGLALNSAES